MKGKGKGSLNINKLSKAAKAIGTNVAPGQTTNIITKAISQNKTQALINAVEEKKNAPEEMISTIQEIVQRPSITPSTTITTAPPTNERIVTADRIPSPRIDISDSPHHDRKVADDTTNSHEISGNNVSEALGSVGSSQSPTLVPRSHAPRPPLFTDKVPDAPSPPVATPLNIQDSTIRVPEKSPTIPSIARQDFVNPKHESKTHADSLKLSTHNAHKTTQDRADLLSAIKKGVQLKKPQTNDTNNKPISNSKPPVSEALEKSLIDRRTFIAGKGDDSTDEVSNSDDDDFGPLNKHATTQNTSARKDNNRVPPIAHTEHTTRTAFSDSVVKPPSPKNPTSPGWGIDTINPRTTSSQNQRNNNQSGAQAASTQVDKPQDLVNQANKILLDLDYSELEKLFDNDENLTRKHRASITFDKPKYIGIFESHMLFATNAISEINKIMQEINTPSKKDEKNTKELEDIKAKIDQKVNKIRELCTKLDAAINNKELSPESKSATHIHGKGSSPDQDQNINEQTTPENQSPARIPTELLEEVKQQKGLKHFQLERPKPLKRDKTKPKPLKIDKTKFQSPKNVADPETKQATENNNTSSPKLAPKRQTLKLSTPTSERTLIEPAILDVYDLISDDPDSPSPKKTPRK